MSFGLTYGSFGDIITTIKLVSRLVQALSESRGSRREFQDLVADLRLYQHVLDQVRPREAIDYLEHCAHAVA